MSQTNGKKTTLSAVYQISDKFTSAHHFNTYCKNITTSNTPGPSAGEKFRSNRAIITSAKSNPENAPQNVIFSPPWGGVVVTRHEHPNVEKFLIIDAGKWLAYEWHAEKIETLKVEEGFGALIYTPDAKNPDSVNILELTPGVTITLQPHQKHSIIAINDLLVLEESVDSKGMDNDLNFDYHPSY